MTDHTAVSTTTTNAHDPDAEIKAQIAALQDKREAIETARTQRAEPTLAEQLAIEQRRLVEDEKFDELLREHGPNMIEMVRPEQRPDVGAVIVKRPHLATYRRFQESGKADFKTFDQLLKPCLLYPGKAEFDALCELMPALHTICCDTIVRLSGHARKETEAKP